MVLDESINCGQLNVLGVLENFRFCKYHLKHFHQMERTESRIFLLYRYFVNQLLLDLIPLSYPPFIAARRRRQRRS